jgi:hypothetical protein
MANIFSDAVNFVGSTLKQVITPDTLKDYKHASLLFVGDQYRLVPKTGFLFHVFIDVNSNVYSSDPANPNSIREIGLMAKTADLPRFSAETKTYNAYNRANIVQSKIKYDPINIAFHDDSSNVVRTFWINYYKHYYRDGDYGLTQYSLPHKYNGSRITEFGYTPRSATPYLRSIRIYSLHQKRFSEYTLINPIIKNFRHGSHNNQNDSDLMQHEMTIEYESVLYNAGRTSKGTPAGFAELHYDTMPSPLTSAGGGPKSIFGPGGLFDTGKDVIDDWQNENYGLSIFKAARGIQNARSMNLKNAAVSEISGAFNSALRQTVSTGSVLVPNLLGTPGAATSPYNGINLNTSLIALAGAALLAESRTPSPINGARIKEVNQATTMGAGKPVGNYNRTFPLAPAAATTTTASNDLALVNDQNASAANTNQKQVNVSQQKQDINNKLAHVATEIARVSDAMNTADIQVKTATSNFNALNSKLVAAQGLPNTNPGKETLIIQLQQSMGQQTDLRTKAYDQFTDKLNELTALNQESRALKSERDTIQ